MGIIQSLRKREGRKPQAGATVTMVPRRSAETPPQLMLLLPDATGIAAYQLNQFPSARAAEFFLDSSLRGRAPEGSVMFWALTWQPTADAATEPLVLIRDTSKPTIYPFSFSDIDSAFEFVRHEMHRGLHLSQVMIYWAVPAHIEIDFWGRSTIQPAEAPASLTVISTSIAEPVLSSDAPIETVAPPSSVIEGEGARYLADDDIAETVRQAEQAASKSPPPDALAANGRVVPMPVPGPSSRKSKKQKTTDGAPPIDFPSASQRVQEGRLARAAVTAWRNFSLAVDEALDVYVARQVATKLAWNRITRALGQAMDAQQQAEIESAERKALEEAKEARLEASRAEKARLETARAAEKQAAAKKAAKRPGLTLAWQNGATALFESARTVWRRAIIADSRANATVAIAAAAGNIDAAKVMREAWLNAAWTLEEAAFAYALEEKSRAIRAWRFATLGIAEATEAHIAQEKAWRLAWLNAGRAIGEAHRASVARRQMFEEAWSEGTTQIRAAVHVRQRLIRVRAGLNNLSIAIEEAIEANAYREEMIEAWDAIIEGLLSAANAKQYCDRAIAAWGNIAFALQGVCRANVKKQKKAIRAWGRIAKALKLALKAKFERDAAIGAWANISLALEESVIARQQHEGLLAAWASASAIVAEAVIAKRVYEVAVTAWANASVALEEAVVACARREFFLEAWENAGDTLKAAANAFLARQASLGLAWHRLTVALNVAVRAKIARDAAIAAWANGSLAIGEMLHEFLVRRILIRFWRNAGRAFAEAVHAHFFKQQSIAAWTTASISIKEALVADALLRIKLAGLDRKHMSGVEKAVKTTVTGARTKTRKTAEAGTGALGKKTAAAVIEEVEAEVTLAPPPLLIGDVKMPAEFLSDEVVEEVILETIPPLEGEFAEALLAAVDAVNLDDDEEPFDEETPDVEAHTPLFPALWRSHDAGRWQPREEPFNGFESPTGRF